jgi:glycosyltransferase involved in cell wall biosynthesis
MEMVEQKISPGATHSAAEAEQSEDANSDLSVLLMTGGIDRPYAYGLTVALASRGAKVDVLGGTELADVALNRESRVRFLNVHGDLRLPGTKAMKLVRHAASYVRMLRCALRSRARIFHILWNYKLEVFDRTVLMVLYKMRGKRIVLTAHNVNAAARDGNESALNKLSLKIQYRLSDHIFVHTDSMKTELNRQFGVKEEAVSVIPFGVNNAVPDTSLTSAEAKQKLGLEASDKAILFFGRIRQYKGLHILVEAFGILAAKDKDYRLVIAGEPKRDTVDYWKDICEELDDPAIAERVIREARFIRDEETEVYFKAADLIVLPYTAIFQSGVIFLSYSFGLPVVAADVGSLGDEIVKGVTGYICRPNDPQDLARAIEAYFESNLYRCLEARRIEIRGLVAQRNSWNEVSKSTVKVYRDLLTQV